MNNESLLEWDELNIIRESVPELVQEYQQTHDGKRVKEWCDWLEFILCHIYAWGWEDAEEVTGTVLMPDGLDDKAVNLEIDGETYRSRILQQLELASLAGVLRIIDTEAHRDYNTGVFDAGKQSGILGLKKQWMTMMDDKVRDQHLYLHGVKVGIDDYFYTDTGESALFPGGFGVPDLDCNCRCFVVLVK